MKTNGFNTGNALRDLFLQSHLHGHEYAALICFHFGWSAQQFREAATGTRIFSPLDLDAIIHIQKVTLYTRHEHVLHYNPNDYDRNTFKPAKP